MPNLGDMCTETNVIQTYRKRRSPAAGGFGGLGAKLPEAGNFLEKQAIINAFG